MTYGMEAACGSFVGTGRSNNQDNFYFNKKRLFLPNKGTRRPIPYKGNTKKAAAFAVFDGMGGECRGAEAAKISAKLFGAMLPKAQNGKSFLGDFCREANAAVNRFRREARLSATGATVAAIYFKQEEMVACNVGDSRVFRVRDGEMLQISQDHTDEKILNAMGLHKKPVLLQFLGAPDQEMALAPHFFAQSLQPGDIYALCTDGVTDVMSLPEMQKILEEMDARAAVEQLLAEVNDRNGTDNTTVIVIKIV